MTISVEDHFNRILEEREKRTAAEIAAVRSELESSRREVAALVDALKQVTTTRLDGMALAVQTQEEVLSGRLAGVNEWRTTVERLIDNTPSKDGVEVWQAGAGQRLGTIENKLAVFDTVTPQVAAHAEIIGDIQKWRSETNGKIAGWGAAAVAASILIGIGFNLLKFLGAGA